MPGKSTHKLSLVRCCYCGARSTLSGDREGRLVCHGCGAPIRHIETVHATAERQRKSEPGKRKPAIPHRAERPGAHQEKDRPCRRKKGKRRKQRSIWYHLGELFDEIEDIFD